MENKEVLLLKHIIRPYENKLFKKAFTSLDHDEKELFYRKVLDNKFSTFFLRFAGQYSKSPPFSKDFLNKAEYQRQIFHVQSFQIIREVLEINKLFTNHGITPIFLKGVAIMDSFDDLSIRSMSDIDILVSKDQIFEAYRALIENGYEEPDKKNWKRSKKNVQQVTEHSHQIPALRGRNNVLIDLHHRITRKNDFNKCPVTDSLLKNKRKIKYYGKDIAVPSANDMFLHCLVNITLNSRFQNSLRSIEDAKQIIDTSNVSLKEVLLTSKNNKFRKAMLLGLHLLERLNVLNHPQTIFLNENYSAFDKALIDKAEKATFSISRSEPYGFTELQLSTNISHLKKLKIIFSRIFISRNEIAYLYSKSNPGLFLIIYVYVKNIILKGINYFHKKIRINSHRSGKNNIDENSIKIEEWFNE